MAASLLLIFFLSTRPPVQKNILNRVLVLVAFAIILGCTRCFGISIAACFWQEQLKDIMEENPLLISVLSYRYFVIFGASLLCAMSAGRLLLMTNPVVFHGINPTSGAVVLCFVTVLICVLDFTYGWILCFGSSYTKMIITNFENEIGIWKEDVQNQTTLAEDWTQNDYCIQLPTLVIIILFTLVLECFKLVYVFLKEFKKLKKTKTDAVRSVVAQSTHQSVPVPQQDETTGRQNSNKCLNALPTDCSSNLKSESRKQFILSIEVIDLETTAPTPKTGELNSDAFSNLTLDYRKESLPAMEVIDVKTNAPTPNLKLDPRKQYLPTIEVIDLESNVPTPNVDILKAGESHPSDARSNLKLDSRKKFLPGMEVIDIETTAPTPKVKILKAGELHSSGTCSNIKLDSRKQFLRGMEVIDIETIAPTPKVEISKAGELHSSDACSNIKLDSRKQFLPEIEVIDLETTVPAQNEDSQKAGEICLSKLVSNLELDFKKKSLLTNEVIDVETNAPTPNDEILKKKGSTFYHY